MNSSYYIHNIDPVILHIWGNLAIRWYGLAYIAGFLAGYALLNRMAKQGNYPLQDEKLQAMFINLVIGIMAGGRLGYVLFYDFHRFVENPLILVRLWEGGMSSHGGMIGLAIAIWYSARTFKTSFLALSDGLVCVGPIGLFFGRLANFINGELWGRVTSVPWAVVFPQEAGIEPGVPGAKESAIRLINQGILSPRHPSQLYQATLEGIVVLTILLLVRKTAWGKRRGRLTGLFLCLYAIVRTASEFFREPEIVHFGWLTQGQMLSIMILLPVGLYFIIRRDPENQNGSTTPKPR